MLPRTTRIVSLLSLVAMLINSAEGGEQCTQPNEEYSVCESHCYEICGREITICPPVCRPGCTCKHGFRMNILGKCVAPEDC